jgi:hypothetical protein
MIFCPICQKEYPKQAMEEHHIIEQAWSRNNGQKVNNNEYNLVMLCGSCHNLISSGEIITEKKVMTTDGLKLMWRHKDATEWNFT